MRLDTVFEFHIADHHQSVETEVQHIFQTSQENKMWKN